MKQSWKQTEIRAARQTPLKPILERLGYRLVPRPNDNYVLAETPSEIIIKKHFWICRDDGTSGNAIDFLVKIQGMSFSNAMELLRS